MSGICDTCWLRNGCHHKSIGNVESCWRYVRAKESNYQRFLGTPKRAARTLVGSCNNNYNYGCSGCLVVRANCKCGDYDALLEWLESEVRDE